MSSPRKCRKLQEIHTMTRISPIGPPAPSIFSSRCSVTSLVRSLMVQRPLSSPFLVVFDVFDGVQSNNDQSIIVVLDHKARSVSNWSMKQSPRNKTTATWHDVTPFLLSILSAPLFPPTSSHRYPCGGCHKRLWSQALVNIHAVY